MDDDSEWQRCLQEASLTGSSSQIRELFVSIVILNNPNDIRSLWDAFYPNFTEDIVYQNPNFNENEILNLTCLKFEQLFNQHGKSMCDFSHLPEFEVVGIQNQIPKIIQDELSYDPIEIQGYVDQILTLNIEQRQTFQTITSGMDKLFFVDGPAGTGKTYLINTLLGNKYFLF